MTGADSISRVRVSPKGCARAERVILVVEDDRIEINGPLAIVVGSREGRRCRCSCRAGSTPPGPPPPPVLREAPRRPVQLSLFDDDDKDPNRYCCERCRLARVNTQTCVWSRWGAGAKVPDYTSRAFEGRGDHDGKAMGSKRISLGKIVRLNIGKRGVGVSFGVTGARIAFGSRGITSSASVPGTGLRWQSTTPSGGARKPRAAGTGPAPSWSPSPSGSPPALPAYVSGPPVPTGNSDAPLPGGRAHASGGYVPTPSGGYAPPPSGYDPMPPYSHGAPPAPVEGRSVCGGKVRLRQPNER